MRRQLLNSLAVAVAVLALLLPPSGEANDRDRELRCDSIVTKKLTVVDDQGRARVVASAARGDAVSLMLFDSGGAARLSLEVPNERIANFTLHEGKTGLSRLILTVVDGQPRVLVNEGKGNLRDVLPKLKPKQKNGRADR